MPQHKSAEKRIRTSQRRRDRNRSVRTRVRGAVRKLEEGAPENQADLLRNASSELDKAVRKGVMKETTVNRKKSRLAKQINKAAKPKE